MRTLAFSKLILVTFLHGMTLAKKSNIECFDTNHSLIGPISAQHSFRNAEFQQVSTLYTFLLFSHVERDQWKSKRAKTLRHLNDIELRSKTSALIYLNLARLWRLKRTSDWTCSASHRPVKTVWSRQYLWYSPSQWYRSDRRAKLARRLAKWFRMVKWSFRWG